MKSDFSAEMKERTRAADAVVLKALPEESGLQKTIFSAMRYSVAAGGKRLRPILMAETFRFFGGQDQASLELFMAAIEMMHTYSLIHDDLPALDNDDYRRGRLTSHKVYGEAMAILAGDALQSYAYETACRAFDLTEDPEARYRIMRALQILIRKPGVYGMIGGQVVDVELTGKPVPKETLNFIFELKTGAMIEAAMMIGACLAGAGEDVLAQVEKAAHDIGMAFQIQDDILDVTGTEAQLGKPVGSDEKNAKTTWVTFYGLERSAEDVRAYTGRALDILAGLKAGEDVQEDFLFAYIRWLISREI